MADTLTEKTCTPCKGGVPPLTQEEAARLLHHVVLTVRDLAEAFPLYDSVLTALGYRLERQNEPGYGWKLETPSGSHSIHLGRAAAVGATRIHDRYSPGLHHLAWSMESREEVDLMHQRLLRIGATVLDPPAEYPQYNKGRGYYAVFFTDPDGLKLECVYTPPLGG